MTLRLRPAKWPGYNRKRTPTASFPFGRPGISLILLLVSVASAAAFSPQTAWHGPTGQFVTCVAQDATSWWWGTEGDGLWRYEPNGELGHNWQHYRGVDGVADDYITALLVDSKGRVWVGTARQGVSVYDGKTWRNYDEITGPLSPHVTAIAQNPKDGSVWMCTDDGLAVYSDSTKTWSYMNRSTGLVSDQLTCIAFTAAGDAIVGTACDGLEIGAPDDGYKSWRLVEAEPDAFREEAGSGIPSDLVNCVLVSKAGTIYCGTDSGLAKSVDSGITWSFIRGKDWAAKVAQRFDHPGAIPAAAGVRDLAEDNISCLAEDDSGRLWIGHWRLGCEVVDAVSGDLLWRTNYKVLGLYIKVLTATPAGMLVGNYGDGLSLAADFDLPHDDAVRLAGGNAGQGKGAGAVSLPEPAVPPTQDELAELNSRIDAAAKSEGDPKAGAEAQAYYLGEDWQTEGDWVGRYGRRYAELFAMMAPFDDYIVSDPNAGYHVDQRMGLGADPNDKLRAWIQWLQTDDPRVLYNPARGIRREAEIDDHGEVEPFTQQGPDIWLKVKVPVGYHRLSLYFMNKDGHTALNRYRDFLVELMSAPGTVDMTALYAGSVTPPAALATARVRDFWPGVYEQFVVKGPAAYYVKVDRNFSVDTILQAVMLDRVDIAGPFSSPRYLAWLSGVEYAPPMQTIKDMTTDPIQAAWLTLNDAYGDSGTHASQRSNRILLLRAATAQSAAKSLIDNWKWQLGLWSDQNRSEFNSSMATALKALRAQLHSQVAKGTKR